MSALDDTSARGAIVAVGGFHLPCAEQATVRGVDAQPR